MKVIRTARPVIGSLQSNKIHARKARSAQNGRERGFSAPPGRVAHSNNMICPVRNNVVVCCLSLPILLGTLLCFFLPMRHSNENGQDNASKNNTKTKDIMCNLAAEHGGGSL